MSRRRQARELRELDAAYADMQQVLLSAALLDSDVNMDSSSSMSSTLSGSNPSSSSSTTSEEIPLIQTVAQALQDLFAAFASIREEVSAPRVPRPRIPQLETLNWARENDER